MNFNNIKKLDNWYNEIKNFEKLSLADAKSLTKLMLSSSGEEKEEYRQRLIFGTLYLVYNFIKSSKIDMINSCDFDMDDVINSCVFEWIKIIDSGEILKVSNYNLFFQRKFYNKLISNLVSDVDKNDSVSCFGGFSNCLPDILKLCLDDINNGIDLDVSRCNCYLKQFTGADNFYNASYVYGVLSSIVEGLRDCDYYDVSKTRLSWLRKLIQADSIIDKSVDVDSFGSSFMLDNVDDRVSFEFLRNAIDSDVLTPKERYVIINRFGFFGNDCKTLAEISGDLGVGRERVRQIEKKAQLKLRVYIYRNYRSIYYENVKKRTFK